METRLDSLSLLFSPLSWSNSVSTLPSVFSLYTFGLFSNYSSFFHCFIWLSISLSPLSLFMTSLPSSQNWGLRPTILVTSNKLVGQWSDVQRWESDLEIFFKISQVVQHHECLWVLTVQNCAPLSPFLQCIMSQSFLLCQAFCLPLSVTIWNSCI